MAVPRCPALRSSIAAHARPLTLLCFCVVTCTVLELQHWDWPPPRLARRPRRPGPRRAVQPPPARALLGSPGVLPPPPPPPPPPPAHPSPHDNTFVQVGGQILFVRQGRRHHVPSCSPCSFRFTMCPSDPSPRTKVPVRILSPGNPHVAALPQGPTFSCAWTPEYGRDGEFAHVGPRIMFIGGGKKHHVIACRPCGPGFTVCDPRPGERTAPPLSLSSAELAVAHELTEGDRYRCSMSPQYFEGYDMWQRRPLQLTVDEAQPRRLNVVLNAVTRDLTGGPLSILRFMNSMLKYTDVGVRLILIDGGGLEAAEFREHARKYPALELLREKGLYVFDAYNPGVSIAVHPGDLFMATLYYTAFTCDATIRRHPALRNRNFVYFIQDFEPIFFPHSAGYVTALETYRYPHFGIYSTPFLQRWFREQKLGQYHFMAAPEPTYSFGTEPAIKPWGLPSRAILEAPGRVRRVIAYARRHADRNAYELTINALSLAACEPAFAAGWEFIGMGAPEDYVEYLGMPCGREVPMQIRRNVPEDEYRQLVQSGDVGLSLMISPHPSLPPFDLVAAGLVTVTNSFGTKTPALLEAVSKNFVVAQPFLGSVVKALVRAAEKAGDVQERLQNAATMNWESDWLGDRCFGPPLMRLVQGWFEVQEPLWPREKAFE